MFATDGFHLYYLGGDYADKRLYTDRITFFRPEFENEIANNDVT